MASSNHDALDLRGLGSGRAHATRRSIWPATTCAIVLGISLSGVPLPASADGLVLTVAPLYSVPLTAPKDVFTSASLGGSLTVSLPFPLFGLSWLTPAAGFSYVYTGLTATTGSLSAVEAQAGLSARLPVAPWLDFATGLYFRGGYYLLNAPGQSRNGLSPGLSAEAGADFRLGPTFSLGLGVQGVNDFGMYAYLRPYLSASVHLLGSAQVKGQGAPNEAFPRPAPLAESESGASRGAGLVLTVAPLYSVPLTAPKDVFTSASLGGSLTVSLPFPLFGLSWLTPAAGFSYVYTGLTATTGSLSAVEAQAGLSARLPVAPWLDFATGLYFRGGYYLLNAPGQSRNGLSPGLSAEAGADFRLGPTFSLGLGVQGVNDFGMYAYLRPYLSASVHLMGGGTTAGQEPSPQPRPAAPPKPAPLVGDSEQKPVPAPQSAEAVSVALDGVFPVFYKYYADHPFGSVTVTNNGKSAWMDVKVSFSMKQFMDLPATLPPIAAIPAGQAVKLDLVSLFNDGILSVTEATKISGELIVDYRENGKPARLSSTVALRVYDRNAMTWADDRRAAAFVTAKDPVILTFAKGLAGDVSASRNMAISDRLQVAAGVHEALSIYGVNYVPDPTGIFAGSKTRTDVDFLQFPRQTLEYRAGDCDDLSILYSALLEAVGIESALITVPGHIYIAASLDMAPEDAKTRFSRVDDLIFREGKTWLPIEVTLRKGGFLAAWTEGAKEWRESSARGLAGFFPVRGAWELYEPVALPGTATLPPLQNARAVEAVKADVETFITGEIAERAARLQADSRKARGASRALNSLGILYAQYGLYAKAAAQFEGIIAREEYVPALLNLGNIRKLLGEYDAALGYYDRAFRKAPTNPSVLLAVAAINHQMENYGVVKRYYQELKKRDPALADRFAFLDLKGEEGAKAADASGLKTMVEWMEGQ